MIIIEYTQDNHRTIIMELCLALEQGKVIAFPTDTSFGLAVDATNLRAIKKLYQVKDRNFNKAVSIIPPNKAYVNTIVRVSKLAKNLMKNFWPGALTIVLPIRGNQSHWQILSAGSGKLGVRIPNHKLAADLAKQFGKPITATSANRSGFPDCFSSADVLKQFKNKKNKPDIIIKLDNNSRILPSTVVEVVDNGYKIIRSGPISEKQISNLLKTG